ncbi:MAG TPA: DUF4138 domain-containing protein [Puia sp.]|nr:DUF4138 domain-containing protein [Puia sp.]
MRSEFAWLAGALIMGASVSWSNDSGAGGIRSPALPHPPPGLIVPYYYGKGDPLENYCQKLMSARRIIYYLNTRSYKMSLQLRGIYAREEVIFFGLRLYNHSHIDYAVDSIRFFMADEKQLGKAPVHGVALPPLYHCGDTGLIRGKTGEFCVFALPRFTLPAGKWLVIEVWEKNGGRRLRLMMDNYTLVKARSI